MSENEALSRISNVQSLLNKLVLKKNRDDRSALRDQINEEIEALVSELANDYERFRHRIESLKSQVDELRSEE